MKSLAEHLGLAPAPDDDPIDLAPTAEALAQMSARDFARGILRSPEYLESVRARVIMGELSPAVEALLWYYAEGKPTDRVEVTGKDGGPLDVRRIERVIVDPQVLKE